MKAIRRPLFWFQLSMWIVSLVISALLIQLGSLVMSDVPTAGNRIEHSDYLDANAMAGVDTDIANLLAAQTANNDALEDAQFRLNAASLDYQTQRENFESWLKTRTATQSSDQNPEVIVRVNAIEALKNEERNARQAIDNLKQTEVSQRREMRELTGEKRDIEAAADAPYQKARSFEVLKVFGLRLALTLPLLLISGWLVAKKRASTYWPIYRSFVIFSLFAFFVELVPYLPSYGGYVRTIVGIAIALIFAHFSIKGMNRYLAKKQSEEDQPEADKRKAIAYETAVKKISDGQCPSCDRSFANPKSKTADTPVDFCVHCGFCLFNKCGNCGTRENSFYKFCGSCGVASGVEND